MILPYLTLCNISGTYFSVFYINVKLIPNIKKVSGMNVTIYYTHIRNFLTYQAFIA